MDELDSNRLEEFRQLRQEVRHSEEYLIVGINVAKDRHHAFFEKPVKSLWGQAWDIWNSSLGCTII
ncbi:MAG: hypothetical protein Q8P64_29515 [Deltaproteobacteria bacterium]|nr:hypothetical protein [Deltaproteobacteria bacterium]